MSQIDLFGDYMYQIGICEIMCVCKEMIEDKCN